MLEKEISLFTGRIYLKSYKSTIIPIPGDMITLSEHEVFKVETRMLSAENDQKVLVFGDIQ